MSTQAIRAVLKDYKDRMEDVLSTELSAAQRKTDEHNLQLAEWAQKELEAIKRAARAFHEDMDPRAMSHAPKSIHDAMDVMTDIAREAK